MGLGRSSVSDVATTGRRKTFALALVAAAGAVAGRAVDVVGSRRRREQRERVSPRRHVLLIEKALRRTSGGRRSPREWVSPQRRAVNRETAILPARSRASGFHTGPLARRVFLKGEYYHGDRNVQRRHLVSSSRVEEGRRRARWFAALDASTLAIPSTPRLRPILAAPTPMPRLRRTGPSLVLGRRRSA